MGLIATSIKCGGAYLVAREGMKAYGKHEERKYNSSNGARSISPNSNMHQSHCNGRCGGQCNGGSRAVGEMSRVSEAKVYYDGEQV